VDNDSVDTIADPDPHYILTPDSTQKHFNKLSFLSLSLDSTATSPTSPVFRKPIPEQALCFSSAASLLEHVTRNWRHNFVTLDLRTEWMIKMFARRPFFMLVNVDGPISDRFRRVSSHLVIDPICSATHVFTEALRLEDLSALSFSPMTLIFTAGGLESIPLEITKLSICHPSISSRNT
jgi:hypothetical protein